MAILGFQLITTLIGSVFLSKIVAYFSFTRCVYSGLKRHLVPNNSQLLEASGTCRVKNKGKKRKFDVNGNDGAGKQDLFFLPRSVPLKLESYRISQTDVASLPLYSSFQWLLDFTVCTTGVYLVTEVAQSAVPLWIAHIAFNRTFSPPTVASQASGFSGAIFINNQLNLSLLWLALTLWFTIRTLSSMTGIYFYSCNQNVTQTNPDHSWTTSGTPRSSDTNSNAECLLVLSAAFIFLILSGFFLVLDGRQLEFHLASGYTNLKMNTTSFLGAPWMSWGAFHIVLAVLCSFLGALFVYPGLKFGRIYLDAVNRTTTMPWYKRLLFHLTFISPLLPILLWIKPVTDHLLRTLTQLRFHPKVIRQPSLQLAVTAASEVFGTHLDTVRLLLCVWILLLRVSITRWSLQVYLYSAQEKLNQLNREPGRISNREVQRIVASVYYCLNLVALQWLGPTILLWTILCLYKSAANLSWIPFHTFHPIPLIHPPIQSSTDRVLVSSPFLLSLLPPSLSGVVIEARIAFHQFINELSTRGAAVLSSVLGFLVWWCLVALQLVTLVGLAYHRFTTV